MSTPAPFFPRVRASVVGAGNIARQMAQNDRLPTWVRDEATKIVLLLSDVPYDLDAVRDLVDCYERDTRGILQEGLEREQHITELENAALRNASSHNADASISAPLAIPLSVEPRRAASGE